MGLNFYSYVEDADYHFYKTHRLLAKKMNIFGFLGTTKRRSYRKVKCQWIWPIVLDLGKPFERLPPSIMYC